jgi:uncharacterized membrane protein YkoI
MLSLRFSILLAAAALFAALCTARAEEPAPPAKPAEYACLNQKERRAELETGKFIKLTTAIRAARSRMPGTVVQVRLCRSKVVGPIAGQEGGGLVYVLTVLAHDGKVARIAVDAVKGTLVGGL